MGLVSEQNVMNHMGVRFNPTAQFQLATNVCRFNMLIVLYPYHIQCIQHLEPVDICRRLELCHWINSNPHMIHNILFTDPAHFTCDGVNNTRNSHLWDRDNPHGNVESNYQHHFSAIMWCGVTRDQLVGPYIFSVTSDRWYLRQSFVWWTASTLKECSSTNMMTDVLPAWRSAATFQSGCQALSES